MSESRYDRLPRIVKNVATVTTNDARLAAKVRSLKRVDDIESELGRLTKLIRDLRADLLHEQVAE